jgi:hypothetical protein
MFPVSGAIEVRGGRVIAAIGAIDLISGDVQPTRDPRLTRNSEGWRLDGAPLPAPAADGYRPIAFEGGVLWDHGGHVWRYTDRLRAVANATRQARLSVGPTGSFAVGAGEYTEAAAPGHSAVPMDIKLDADHWGVRWSADGETLFGADADGKGWSWHIARRRLSPLAGLPLDAETVVTDRIPGIEHPVVEASCALSGHHLAGPGGLVWDLREEAPVCGSPVIRLGTTFALADRFGTVDWEHGDGAWVDLRGAIIGEFRIPLDDEDAIEDSWGDADHGWIRTSAGRIFMVRPSGVSEEDDAPEPAEPATVGRLTRNGLDLGIGLPLPADAAAIVGDRTFAWSQDGLLVRLANDLPSR